MNPSLFIENVILKKKKLKMNQVEEIEENQVHEEVEENQVHEEVEENQVH